MNPKSESEIIKLKTKSPCWKNAIISLSDLGLLVIWDFIIILIKENQSRNG